MRIAHFSLFALSGLSLGSPVLSKRADAVGLLTDLYATVQIYTGAISTLVPPHSSLTHTNKFFSRRHSSPPLSILESPRQNRRNSPGWRANQPPHRSHHIHHQRRQCARTRQRDYGVYQTLYFYCYRDPSPAQAETPTHYRRCAAVTHHRRDLRYARCGNRWLGSGGLAGIHQPVDGVVGAVDC